MYQSGFVVVVKNEKGKVLREQIIKTKGDFGINSLPQVYLPFNTHYSILLKNNNNRNAVATIYIDGTEVMSNRRIIVPANSDVEVERFCIDGDLNSGRRFYFVPKDDSRVSDPTSKENGLIEVIFRLEKENVIDQIIDNSKKQPSTFPYTYNPWPSPWDKQPFPNFNFPWKRTYPSWTFGAYNSVKSKQNYSDSTLLECNVKNNDFNNSIGATVEGGHSSQKFTEASIGELETQSTTIKIQLRGLIEEDKKQRIEKIEELKKQIRDLEKKINSLNY